MKKLNLSLLVLLVFTLSGCEVIGGIFKAGAFVGILAVVVVIGAVLWLMSLFRGGNK